MIAVRTDQSAEIARQRLRPSAKHGLPDEEGRDEALLVKVQRPGVEGHKPTVDADLCFGCVDWYMYPRQQAGKVSSDNNG